MRFFVLFFVVVIRSSLLFKNQNTKRFWTWHATHRGEQKKRVHKISMRLSNVHGYQPLLLSLLLLKVLLLSYHFTTFCMYAFCSLLCTNLARSTIWWNRSCWVVNTQVHIWSALCVLRTVLFTHWGECTFNQCLCRT